MMQEPFIPTRDLPLTIIAVVVLFKLVMDAIKPYLQKKEPGRINGSSGAQDVAFWQTQIKENAAAAIHEHVSPALTTQATILENQTKILESIADKQQGVAQGVATLVDRGNRRR